MPFDEIDDLDSVLAELGVTAATDRLEGRSKELLGEISKRVPMKMVQKGATLDALRTKVGLPTTMEREAAGRQREGRAVGADMGFFGGVEQGIDEAMLPAAAFAAKAMDGDSFALIDEAVQNIAETHAAQSAGAQSGGAIAGQLIGTHAPLVPIMGAAAVGGIPAAAVEGLTYAPMMMGTAEDALNRGATTGQALAESVVHPLAMAGGMRLAGGFGKGAAQRAALAGRVNPAAATAPRAALQAVAEAPIHAGTGLLMGGATAALREPALAAIGLTADEETQPGYDPSAGMAERLKSDAAMALINPLMHTVTSPMKSAQTRRAQDRDRATNPYAMKRVLAEMESARMRAESQLVEMERIEAERRAAEESALQAEAEEAAIAGGKPDEGRLAVARETAAEQQRLINEQRAKLEEARKAEEETRAQEQLDAEQGAGELLRPGYDMRGMEPGAARVDDLVRMGRGEAVPGPSPVSPEAQIRLKMARGEPVQTPQEAHRQRVQEAMAKREASKAPAAKPPEADPFDTPLTPQEQHNLAVRGAIERGRTKAGEKRGMLKMQAEAEAEANLRAEEAAQADAEGRTLDLAKQLDTPTPAPAKPDIAMPTPPAKAAPKVALTPEQVKARRESAKVERETAIEDRTAELRAEAASSRRMNPEDPDIKPPVILSGNWLNQLRKGVREGPAKEAADAYFTALERMKEHGVTPADAVKEGFGVVVNPKTYAEATQILQKQGEGIRAHGADEVARYWSEAGSAKARAKAERDKYEAETKQQAEVEAEAAKRSEADERADYEAKKAQAESEQTEAQALYARRVEAWKAAEAERQEAVRLRDKGRERIAEARIKAIEATMRAGEVEESAPSATPAAPPAKSTGNAPAVPPRVPDYTGMLPKDSPNAPPAPSRPVPAPAAGPARAGGSVPVSEVRPPGTGGGVRPGDAAAGPARPGAVGGEPAGPSRAGVAREERADAEGTGEEGGGNAELIRQREAELGKARADAERSEVVKAAEEQHRVALRRVDLAEQKLRDLTLGEGEESGTPTARADLAEAHEGVAKAKLEKARVEAEAELAEAKAAEAEALADLTYKTRLAEIQLKRQEMAHERQVSRMTGAELDAEGAKLDHQLAKMTTSVQDSLTKAKLAGATAEQKSQAVKLAAEAVRVADERVAVAQAKLADAKSRSEADPAKEREAKIALEEAKLKQDEMKVVKAEADNVVKRTKVDVRKEKIDAITTERVAHAERLQAHAEKGLRLAMGEGVTVEITPEGNLRAKIDGKDAFDIVVDLQPHDLRAEDFPNWWESMGGRDGVRRWLASPVGEGSSGARGVLKKFVPRKLDGSDLSDHLTPENLVKFMRYAPVRASYERGTGRIRLHANETPNDRAPEVMGHEGNHMVTHAVMLAALRSPKMKEHLDTLIRATGIDPVKNPKQTAAFLEDVQRRYATWRKGYNPDAAKIKAAAGAARSESKFGRAMQAISDWVRKVAPFLFSKKTAIDLGPLFKDMAEGRFTPEVMEVKNRIAEGGKTESLFATAREQMPEDTFDLRSARADAERAKREFHALLYAESSERVPEREINRIIEISKGMDAPEEFDMLSEQLRQLGVTPDPIAKRSPAELRERMDKIIDEGRLLDERGGFPYRATGEKVDVKRIRSDLNAWEKANRAGSAGDLPKLSDYRVEDGQERIDLAPGEPVIGKSGKPVPGLRQETLFEGEPEGYIPPLHKPEALPPATDADRRFQAAPAISAATAKTEGRRVRTANYNRLYLEGHDLAKKLSGVLRGQGKKWEDYADRVSMAVGEKEVLSVVEELRAIRDKADPEDVGKIGIGKAPNDSWEAYDKLIAESKKVDPTLRSSDPEWGESQQWRDVAARRAEEMKERLDTEEEMNPTSETLARLRRRARDLQDPIARREAQTEADALAERLMPGTTRKQAAAEVSKLIKEGQRDLVKELAAEEAKAKAAEARRESNKPIKVSEARQESIFSVKGLDEDSPRRPRTAKEDPSNLSLGGISPENRPIVSRIRDWYEKATGKLESKAVEAKADEIISEHGIKAAVDMAVKKAVEMRERGENAGDAAMVRVLEKRVEQLMDRYNRDGVFMGSEMHQIVAAMTELKGHVGATLASFHDRMETPEQRAATVQRRFWRMSDQEGKWFRAQQRRIDKAKSSRDADAEHKAARIYEEAMDRFIESKQRQMKKMAEWGVDLADRSSLTKALDGDTFATVLRDIDDVATYAKDDHSWMDWVASNFRSNLLGDPLTTQSNQFISNLLMAAENTVYMAKRPKLLARAIKSGAIGFAAENAIASFKEGRNAWVHKITGEELGRMEDNYRPTDAISRYGRMLSFDIMAAIDGGFQRYNAQLAAVSLTYKAARREGRSPKEAREAASEIVGAGLSGDVALEAMFRSLPHTFQELALSRPGQREKLDEIVSKVTGIGTAMDEALGSGTFGLFGKSEVTGEAHAIPVSKIALPFVRTTIALARAASRRSFLGSASVAIAAGKVWQAKKLGEDAATIQFAKDQMYRRVFESVVVGGIAMHALAAMLDVVGTGEDDKEAAMTGRAKGEKTLSLFGHRIPYSRVEPFATPLAMAANGMKALREGRYSEIATEELSAMLKLGSDLAWFRMIAGIGQTVQDIRADRKNVGTAMLGNLGGWAGRTAVAATPIVGHGVVRAALKPGEELTRAADKGEGFFDAAWQAGKRELGGNYTVNRDVWGRKIRRGPDAGFDTPLGDPVGRAIAGGLGRSPKYQPTDVDGWLAERKVTMPAWEPEIDGEKLKGDKLEAFVEKAGPLLLEAMRGVKSRNPNITAEQLDKAISKIKTGIGKRVKRELSLGASASP